MSLSVHYSHLKATGQGIPYASFKLRVLYVNWRQYYLVKFEHDKRLDSKPFSATYSAKDLVQVNFPSLYFLDFR